VRRASSPPNDRLGGHSPVVDIGRYAHVLRPLAGKRYGLDALIATARPEAELKFPLSSPAAG
jgi:hypothetical protein